MYLGCELGPRQRPRRGVEMRKLQIQVLTRDGRKNIYETDRFRNVADLKKHIGRNMNVPMAFSRLTYKGRLLTNDSILEDEGIKRMSTLELYWQPLVLTPKQYREKELELDKQEQKARHVSRIADNFEQTMKKAGTERTPSGIRRTRDQVRAKRSLSADDMKQQPTVQRQQNLLPTEEASSSSSDEQDFLENYWCCPKSGIKINRPATAAAATIAGAEAAVGDDDNDRSGDVDNDVDVKLKSAAKSCCQLQGNFKLSSEDLLQDEVLEKRCLSCKQQQPQPHQFRMGPRLIAGRMSRSIISNIRKNQKNHKK